MPFFNGRGTEAPLYSSLQCPVTQCFTFQIFFPGIIYWWYMGSKHRLFTIIWAPPLGLDLEKLEGLFTYGSHLFSMQIYTGWPFVYQATVNHVKHRRIPQSRIKGRAIQHRNARHFVPSVCEPELYHSVPRGGLMPSSAQGSPPPVSWVQNFHILITNLFTTGATR